MKVVRSQKVRVKVVRSRKVRVKVVQTEKAAEAVGKQLKTIRSTGSIGYSQMIDTLRTAIDERTKLVTLDKHRKMFSPEISRLSSIRRKQNREWRKARHSGTGVEEAKQRYRQAQEVVRSEIAPVASPAGSLRSYSFPNFRIGKLSFPKIFGLSFRNIATFRVKELRY